MSIAVYRPACSMCVAVCRSGDVRMTCLRLRWRRRTRDTPATTPDTRSVDDSVSLSSYHIISYYTRLTTLFRDYPGKPVPER